MANMHILLQSGGMFRIVAHIAVPAGNNSAGIAWQTVVVTSGVGGKTVLPAGDGTGGTISAAEKTAILTTGSVYEDVADLDVTQRGLNTTPAQPGAYLDLWYTARSAEVLGQLQRQLAWYGQTR
jgi:hypothetical protein